jgi:glutamine synthetase
LSYVPLFGDQCRPTVTVRARSISAGLAAVTGRRRTHFPHFPHFPQFIRSAATNASDAHDLTGLPTVIHPEARNAAGLRALVEAHPNIRFVSLAAVDLGGNETDERIPVSSFLPDAEVLLAGGVQTDGSSVVLPGIATLNDGKVDLIADPEARWFVDYNDEYLDAASSRPVGTIKIPAFLRHSGVLVDARSVLARAETSVQRRLLELLQANPRATQRLGFREDEIEDVILTAATELEFWVRTPGAREDVDQLAVSQALQEQYWKPTKGAVRSGLERALLALEAYGLQPEMGHKEVGGVDARVVGTHGVAVMEQIEIDWRFDTARQAADNELFARTFIARAFRAEGLEVTFLAKPIEGVAGSGEHTHVGLAVLLQDGTIRNLFTAGEPDRDYLSEIGWGALMGLLRRWEVVGPFVTCSTDAFNRLKPGFEAPVCIVGAVGHTVAEPSRNRSVLAGLVRDSENSLATRFEVRAPNPHTNSFLAIAAMYQAMLDGIAYAVGSGKTAHDLEREFSKEAGEPATYLESGRAYRSEDDVFEHFDEAERDRLFGRPPATVHETLRRLEQDEAGRKVLMAGEVFDERLIRSYRDAMRSRWLLELSERILPANAETVRECSRIHGEDEDGADEEAWQSVQALRRYLMRDSGAGRSLFTRIREAIERGDDTTVSELQQEMNAAMSDLRRAYATYTRNVLDPIAADGIGMHPRTFTAVSANLVEP